MDFRKLACGAAAYAAISQVVHTIGAFASMGYYADPSLFPMWSKLMMPGPSPPGAEFYIASLAIGLVVGAIYTSAYQLFKTSFLANAKRNFRANDPYSSGLKFGAFIFLMSGLPSFLSMWLLFALPLGLQLSWLAEGIAICLLYGISVARIYR